MTRDTKKDAADREWLLEREKHYRALGNWTAANIMRLCRSLLESAIQMDRIHSRITGT